VTNRLPEAGDRSKYLTVYEIQTDDIGPAVAARSKRIADMLKAATDPATKCMKERHVIAYKAITEVKSKANTPPAPYANKTTPPAPEPPPVPGMRRFLLAVETNLKDPAQAAVFNTWYNDVHIVHPELGFMETRTAEIVGRELKANGFKVRSGIAKTGVVGVLENGPGPIVMFRADMDCNAVEEATGLPYASTKRVTRMSTEGRPEEVPVMHACGHDAHTTWLIGLAKAMAANTSEWKGTLVLVAQPAEEPIEGARAMVQDGLYSQGVPKPDYLIGLHTTPARTGMVISQAGDLNAGTDQLDVTFHGVGGHGSAPHVAKDPVLMAAAAIVQYQFIISRGIDPQKAAVLTVGSVQAGSDNNVIPASALLKLNLRWYDEKDRNLMLEGIERINRSIAASYNMPESRYPTTVRKGWSYPLSNDPDMASRISRALRLLLGDRNVISVPPLMGSEDFHHLVIDNEKKHYHYMYVGTAKPEHFLKAQQEGKQVPYANHNPDYQVDLDAIPLGAKIGATAILTMLTA
jgi:amidohydrolase